MCPARWHFSRKSFSPRAFQAVGRQLSTSAQFLGSYRQEFPQASCPRFLHCVRKWLAGLYCSQPIKRFSLAEVFQWSNVRSILELRIRLNFCSIFCLNCKTATIWNKARNLGESISLPPVWSGFKSGFNATGGLSLFRFLLSLPYSQRFFSPSSPGTFLFLSKTNHFIPLNRRVVSTTSRQQHCDINYIDYYYILSLF